MATTRFCLIGLCALVLSLCFAVSWHGPVDTQTLNGCGPKSLSAVSRRLGVEVSQEQVLRMMGDHAEVSSFADLQAAAGRLGLKATGVDTTVQEMARSKTLGILHVEGFHFIAVVGYQPHSLVVVDPASPSYPQEQALSYAALQQIWDGRMLTVAR